MTKYHLKRLPAPKQWRIARKVYTYIAKPFPGGHPYEAAMSLNEVMIGLDLADNRREVRRILNHKKVLVDGKRKFSQKDQAGFMDVLSFPDTKQNYRITICAEGIRPIEINEQEAKVKLVKIKGKSQIKGGKFQIHTHDGRNMAVDKNAYKVGDSLLIEIPGQKIKEHFKMEAGATILLYKGNQIGKIGKVEKIETRTLTFTVDKDKFDTKKEYAFVVGKDKAVIQIQNEPSKT